MDDLEYYREHSEFTDPGPYRSLYDGLPGDVTGLSEVVRAVVTHRNEPQWRYDFEVPDSGRADADTRYTHAILAKLGDLSPRAPEAGFFGTCRDFSVLLCSMLREQGTPARPRHGFSGYFGRDFFDDHVVVEYWHDDHGWRLADAQIAGPEAREVYKPDFDPADVPRDRFLVGGQAWGDCLTGVRDPRSFGVGSVPELRGMWEVQGNVVRDLAALNRVESLPWDAWGVIARRYEILTADDRELLDRAAGIGRAGGPLSAARALYESDRRLTYQA